MIIMGTHGRVGIDRMLFGSVAEKVVKTSKAPVLTVRPE
jgi:nucleotide-binding universal stress UspA family protein